MTECVMRNTSGASALVVRGGAVTAENSNFVDNEHLQGAGSALAMVGGKFQATACNFTRNSAAEGGAVVVNGSDAQVTLMASQLSGNSATLSRTFARRSALSLAARSL